MSAGTPRDASSLGQAHFPDKLKPCTTPTWTQYAFVEAVVVERPDESIRTWLLTQP